MENYYVVIPAAGQGKRMKAGINKQFLLMDKTPLLIHTLRVFEEDLLCISIILVVNKDEKEIVQALVAKYNISKVDHVVEGGAERQQSVFEGLKVLKGNPIVLVHDGARPFINQSSIHTLVTSVLTKGSSIIATPVKDTIKQVINGVVAETVDRSSLWAVQTPQAFRLETLLYAHRQAELTSYLGTDDASLLEYVGEMVHVVEGDYENIKITTPEDMLFGEAILQKRRDGKS
ncbi:2-C-methyl-D-erythritol 4-phosphate cytidylyltransferase [Evansella sp. AB-rgal1]|uniref:2-C-methyl-D-erythritol 4-phosphate cytidylyltransferase n=1 Tax=Evansella sp. AB-rgal1 TaxID=3242696 RepID=UPI00359E047F